MRHSLLITVFVFICNMAGAQPAVSCSTGDVVFYADSPESTDLKWFYIDLSPDSIAKTTARVRYLEKNYRLFDCIQKGKWRYKTEKYDGIQPVATYGARITEVYGIRNGIYMYAPNINKAPKLGTSKDKIRWGDNTEMRLVIHQMTPNGRFWDITVAQYCNIFMYYRTIPTVKDAKKIINVP